MQPINFIVESIGQEPSLLDQLTVPGDFLRALVSLVWVQDELSYHAHLFQGTDDLSVDVPDDEGDHQERDDDGDGRIVSPVDSDRLLVDVLAHHMSV